MLDKLKRRVTAPFRKPIDGVRSLLVGLPADTLRELVSAPAQLKSLAHLQCSLFEFRYLLAVLLARRAGVFAALERAPLRVDRLAQECRIHPEAARTLARVLESQGIVHVEGAQVSLSEFAGRHLTSASSASLLPVIDLLLTYAEHFSQIADALHTGMTPAVLDVRNDDATTDAVLQAVNSHLAKACRELLDKARLPEVEHFIVGSMGVSFSAELLRRHPNARVTYGCLAHLVERIPQLREQYEVDPQRVCGMHAHAGRPADDTWGAEAYDLVFLTRKMILDPQADLGVQFARKAFDVLRPGGVAVFWEAVHPDDGPSPLPLALETVFDLGMSPSAPLKTRASIGRTLRQMGYGRIDHIACLGGTTTFVVAHRPN